MPASTAVSTGLPLASRVMIGSAFEHTLASPIGWRTLDTNRDDSGSTAAVTRYDVPTFRKRVSSAAE
jgi:hypothetical protein